MPPRMVIQSPRLRSSVIAAIMLFVLIGSLVLAMVTFSTTHHVTIRALSLEIPSHWRIDADKNGSGNESAAVGRIDFFDGDIRVLRLFDLTVGHPVSPRFVLQQFVVEPPPRSALRSRLVRVDDMQRGGGLAGVTARVISIDPNDPYTLGFRMVAIVTRDGRHFWLIDMPYDGYYDGDVPLEQVPFQFPEDIFNRIIKTLQLDAPPAPTSEQFAHMHLPPALPASWRASMVTDVNWPADVLLAPNELPGNHLAIMRVRGAIDVTATNEDADHALDPVTLLTRHYARVITGPVKPADVSVDYIGASKTARVWRLTLEKGKDGRLAVQAWYAKLGHGRAAVLELVSDGPDATEALSAQAMDYLASLTSDETDATAAVDAARTRGVQLAQWHRANLATALKQGLTFRMTETRDAPSGLEIQFVAPPGASADATWPLHARSDQVGFLEGKPAYEHTRAWSSNADASRYKTLVTTIALRSDKGVMSEVYQVGAVDGRVNMTRPGEAGAPPQVVWNVAADPAFVPTIVVDEKWPIDILGDMAKSEAPGGGGADGAAVLWLALDPSPPEPWVFTVTDHAPPDVLREAKAGGHTILHARPAMAIDGHYLLLDKEGRVVTTYLFEPNSEVAGPTERVTRRVDQMTLEHAFGDQRDTIRKIVDQFKAAASATSPTSPATPPETP